MTEDKKMKTIAVIDDDIHISQMICEILKQEGYEVIVSIPVPSSLSSGKTKSQSDPSGSDDAGILR